MDILKEEKTTAQLASEYGIHPNLLRDWKLIALKALLAAFEKRDALVVKEAAHELQLQELYAEIGRLTTPVTFLKKVAALTRSERLASLEREASDLPLTTQAQLLNLNRTSLYYIPVPPPPQELAIKHRIDELYTAHPFYGSRKIAVLLRPTFGAINRKQRILSSCGVGIGRSRTGSITCGMSPWAKIATRCIRVMRREYWRAYGSSLIDLWRWQGWTNIADAIRDCVASVPRTLAVIGAIPSPTLM